LKKKLTSTINALGKYKYPKMWDHITPFVVEMILTRKKQMTLLLLANFFLDGSALL
jgi:hypothetical protein